MTRRSGPIPPGKARPFGHLLAMTQGAGITLRDAPGLHDSLVVEPSRRACWCVGGRGPVDPSAVSAVSAAAQARGACAADPVGCRHPRLSLQLTDLALQRGDSTAFRRRVVRHSAARLGALWRALPRRLWVGQRVGSSGLAVLISEHKSHGKGGGKRPRGMGSDGQ